MGNKLERLQRADIDQEYEILERIGVGGFAVVKRCVNKLTGIEYAVKIVKKKGLTIEELDTINDEVEILQRLVHPNIVRLEQIFETQRHLFMVMELLSGGELFDTIASGRNFSEKEAAQVIKDLTKAVQYMHQNGIVHRDLKPENLIYSSDDYNSPIKITDFGFAKFVSPREALTTPCGTPGYIAPEVLNSEPYGPEVDLWSIGVILYILLCGYPPFYAETPLAIFELIKLGEFNFSGPNWEWISEEAKDLVTRLLVIKPAHRFTCKQVLAHPWIASDQAPSESMGPEFTRQFLKFMARKKLRKAITLVMAMNKLSRDIEDAS